ncbi:ras-related protein Rab-10-like [Carcharodon carcharias]|uniref:ras-related protein Rab-10-like n=1 Tax=Carcharodon carcharias TaxID=13397 RepID=UPI001B7F06CD|nr:ras-related protein Rab-10-like [Carcharodon carcharias]
MRHSEVATGISFDSKAQTMFTMIIWIDFRVKTIKIRENCTIKLQIWDTAGQERFHALTTHYCRGSNGLMLVYDITNLKTFTNITYWIKDTDEHAENDVGRILIGNKCDMMVARQVSWDNGKRLAQEHGMQFFETSAKEDMNIDKAFAALGEEIIRKNPKLLPNADSIHIKESSVQTCCTGRTIKDM